MRPDLCKFLVRSDVITFVILVESTCTNRLCPLRMDYEPVLLGTMLYNLLPLGKSPRETVFSLSIQSIQWCSRLRFCEPLRCVIGTIDQNVTRIRQNLMVNGYTVAAVESSRWLQSIKYFLHIPQIQI